MLDDDFYKNYLSRVTRPGYGVHLRSFMNFRIKKISGNRWSSKSKISMGLVRVPLVSMRIFSTTWGIGVIGAASIIMVKTISTEYGILTWFDDSISRHNFKSGSTWTVWTMVLQKLFYWWNGKKHHFGEGTGWRNSPSFKVPVTLCWSSQHTVWKGSLGLMIELRGIFDS